MSKISEIKARQIIDSRGNPTVEVDVILADGSLGRASVPSGASVGSREALEMRDGNVDFFAGKSVLKPIQNISEIIAPKLQKISIFNQEKIDQILIELDGTENKSKLGANATLAVSLACAKAAAISKKVPLFEILGGGSTLPIPMMNFINGGAHASNDLSLQEFMIMPVGFDSFKEAIRCGCEIFYHLKNILIKNSHSTNVGDEGGFAPNLKKSADAFDFIVEATEKAGYEIGSEVFFAIDAAASEFFSNGKYEISEKSSKISSDELIKFYQDLINAYPIISLEDPIAEHDLEGWKKITDSLGSKIQIVGDDLFVTNQKILQSGHEAGLANAILIKPNQIGTLTETLGTINLAKKLAYNSIISHRSGETEDVTITHLCVGMNAGQIKTGSLSRSDRVAKYNELLRIEEFLGNKAVYAGAKV